MNPEHILSGIETEYGLAIEGRTPHEQVGDAADVVRCCTARCWEGWDYRHESPRADLRGFTLASLATDPVDAAFDTTKPAWGREERADRILGNGARFYNDHGHPEYATPECRSALELAWADKVGERVVLTAAQRYEQETGRRTRVYKNNTDHHGASYGTHEAYLAPRSMGFEGLVKAVMPILIARIPLCGAGKVGAENGTPCDFQLSQRADFFTEPWNAETLYRRPVFNTRDEPHADPERWIRLHVICGDANMLPSATARKVELVRLALALGQIGEAPVWPVSDPVRAFQSVSRDLSFKFRIELEGGRWTTAREIVESVCATAERFLDLSPTTQTIIAECRQLWEDLEMRHEAFASKVDWAAKRQMLQQFIESEGTSWRDPALVAYDLEFHNLDPDEGLCRALQQMELAEADPPEKALDERMALHAEPTRARARGLAALGFGSSLRAACWRSLVFETPTGLREIELHPDREFAMDPAPDDVESFVETLEP